MNPILRTVRAYAADARDAFRIAPAEVVLCVLVAASFSLSLRAEREFPMDGWARVMVWAWLSFCPLLALTVLHLRGAVGRRTRVAVSALVVLGAGAYAFTLFDPEHGAEVWRFATLMLSGIFFVLLTPAVPPRAGDRMAHWQFAFGLLARAFGVAVYSVVIFAALAGAVASVVNLFELGQPDHLYQDMAAWIFLAAAPWILVGGVERLLEDAVRPREGAPLAVERFGRFVYAPVVVVYLVILYAYAMKVLTTQELPKNLVSPLVLGAGLLGMAGALLLEPVHADRQQRGLSLLVRWVPALLLPLIPFALIAILMRQGQYGWTEFRYLRLTGTLLLTVVALLGTVWLARRRMPPLASVPGILALGLLIVSLGPWSAQAVSRRDQQARLRVALAKVGLRAPVRLEGPDSVTVTEKQAEEIRGLVRYLVSSHGVGAAAAVLGPEAAGYPDAWRLTQALPLRMGCAAGDEWLVAAYLPGEAWVPVQAGQLGTVIFGRRRAGAKTPVRVRTVGSRVQVDHQGWSARVELAPLVRRLAAQRTPECGREWRGLQLPAEGSRFPLRDGPGRVRGELILTELEVQYRTVGPDRGLLIERGVGHLLLR